MQSAHGSALDCAIWAEWHAACLCDMASERTLQVLHASITSLGGALSSPWHEQPWSSQECLTEPLDARVVVLVPGSRQLLHSIAHATLQSMCGNSIHSHTHVAPQHGTRVVLGILVTPMQTLRRRRFTGQNPTHRDKVWNESSSYQPHQPAARHGGPLEPPSHPQPSPHPFPALSWFQCCTQVPRADC